MAGVVSRPQVDSIVELPTQDPHFGADGLACTDPSSFPKARMHLVLLAIQLQAFLLEYL